MVESTANIQPQEESLPVEDAPQKEYNDAKEETVENMDMKKIKQLMSPFINHQKSWEDEDTFMISKELQRGIIDELGFFKPSKIQGVAIPLIVKPVDGNYLNLIAQSRNGSGKTGAFSIGSILRVDPTVMKPQVLVLGHIRELANQIAAVYEKVCKFSDIKVSNFASAGACDGHIVVTTLGKLEANLKSRGKSIDLSELKCLVVDEADHFFGDQKNLQTIQVIDQKYLKKIPKNPIQYILFSATYPDTAVDAINQIVTEAQMIQLSKEQLQLNHIQQFEMRCERKKKPQFVMDVFATCSMTQTVIFVNTKQFAELLHKLMRNAGYKATIIFGDMSKDERDEMVTKFRTQEVNVIITTNMLARGIDVPEVQIVINFDVPHMRTPGIEGNVGDPENYIHRIGRTGRFGTKGIAVSLYDRDEDKKNLDQIMDYYNMKDKLLTLEGPDHLAKLLEEINQV